jgi:hypothetical protein
MRRIVVVAAAPDHEHRQAGAGDRRRRAGETLKEPEAEQPRRGRNELPAAQEGWHAGEAGDRDDEAPLDPPGHELRVEIERAPRLIDDRDMVGGEVFGLVRGARRRAGSKKTR